MPAKFIGHLLRPFSPLGRYRHGFDPPGPLTRFPFLPSAFDGKPLLLPCPTNIFCLPLIAPQLTRIEPFLNPFRQTDRQPILPEPASKEFEKKRNR